MDEIGATSVFADGVMDRSNHSYLLREPRGFLEGLSKTNAWDGCVDQVVIRSRGPGLGAATGFRIERVNLRHAAAKPNEDAMFRAATRNVRPTHAVSPQNRRQRGRCSCGDGGG